MARYINADALKLWWSERYNNRDTVGVNQVISAIEDAPTAWNTRPDNWISVEDRLPEHSARILAYTPPSGNTAAHTEVSRGFMARLGKRTDITHWQPLPEPPKGE